MQEPGSGDSGVPAWRPPTPELDTAPQAPDQKPKAEMSDVLIIQRAQLYWGKDLKDPFNSDAAIARDNKWINVEADEITPLGIAEIKRRYAEEMATTIQTAAVEKSSDARPRKKADKPVRKEAVNGPSDTIRIILIDKFGIPENLVKVYRGNQSGHYEVQVFSPNKIGGNSRHEVVRTYKGTMEQITAIIDKGGHLLVSELKQRGVNFE